MNANIDLTEHRDFRDKYTNSFNITLLGIEWEEDMIVSPDEYEIMAKWESIFGKRRHLSQRRQIFNDEEKFYEKWRDKCERCGKSLRCPWKSVYRLCIECNDATENSRIPWIELYGEAQDNRNRTMDIFRMR